LRELEQGLNGQEFDEEVDRELLKKLYGANDHAERTLVDEYNDWSHTANASEEERQAEGCASPEESVKIDIDLIRTEIKRLVAYDKAQRQVDSTKVALDKLRTGILTSPDVERFLRYEASIERAIDRTLTQLERRPQIRLGQVIVADVDVNVSG
jgi:hypothetical protein